MEAIQLIDAYGSKRLTAPAANEIGLMKLVRHYLDIVPDRQLSLSMPICRS